MLKCHLFDLKIDSVNANFDSASGHTKYMYIIYQSCEKQLFAAAWTTLRHITKSFSVTSPTPLCHIKSAEHLCDATTWRISWSVSLTRHSHLANPQQLLLPIWTCHCKSCSVSSALGSSRGVGLPWSPLQSEEKSGMVILRWVLEVSVSLDVPWEAVPWPQPWPHLCPVPHAMVLDWVEVSSSRIYV